MSSLTVLTEERDFLLASLADLEVEYESGDLSELDYRALKDDYTVRASDLIRKIDGLAAAAESRDGRGEEDGRLTRLALTIGALLVFAIGSGWLLAQAVGERGATGSLTGTIDETIRDRVLNCQQLMSSGELRDSLACFDGVLAEDPQNVEALTYKGWFLILASGTAQQAGDDDAFAQFVALGEKSLADAVAVDPEFADARAFRAVVFSRLGREEAACAEIAILDDLRPAPMITQLITPIATRLACE